MPSDPTAPVRGCGIAPEDVTRLLDASARSAPLDLGAGPAAERLAFAVLAAADPVLLPRALPPLLRAIESDRGTLAPFARAVDHHLRGIAAWRIDHDVPQAVASLDRAAVGLAEIPSAQAYAGRVNDTLGQLLHQQGLLVDAREAFERALAAKQVGGDSEGVALTLGNLGRLCMALGDFRSAARHLTDDLAHVVAMPTRVPRLESQLYTEIGICRTELGEHDEARRCLELARDGAANASQPISVAFAVVHLGRLAMRTGDVAGGASAVAAAGHALAPLSPSELGELRGLVALLAARVRWAHDDLVGASDRLEEAERLFDAAPRVSPVERAELYEVHATVADAAGRRREAVSLLRRALTALDATSAEAMRARIDGALRRLDETAWMLHATGRFIGHAQLEELLGEAGRSGFRGHEEEVTVLFSDVRGFTRFAEALAPDVLVETINRYFGHMTRCVEHFGGRVDKFIGDAVMAIFAARPGPTGHADRAVEAALYMQAELSHFNRSLPSGVGPLRMGIGLHAGTVVAGLLGSPRKRSYTVIGDVVNTASRVEGMTKVLGAPIVVTSEVVRRMTDAARFVSVPLGRYRPVGRRASVDVHLVAGHRDTSPEALAHEALAADARTAWARFAARDFADAGRRFRALASRVDEGAGGAAFALLAATAARLSVTAPPDAWGGEIELTEK
jgi:class 3 adenylate cyclase